MSDVTPPQSAVVPGASPEAQAHNDRESARDRAELTKLQRETQKLDEEIKAIRRQSSRLWRGLALGRDALGIVAVVATLFYGISNYIRQEEQRNKFTVTREVITLVQQLGESEQGQGNAAILLSAYGEHAIPVLLNTLTISDAPGLVAALELIGEEDPDRVISPLRQRAASAMDGVLAGQGQALRSFKNYVKALGAVGAQTGSAETVELLKRLGNELKCDHLLKQGEFDLDVVERRLTCKELDDACQKVSPGACPW